MDQVVLRQFYEKNEAYFADLRTHDENYLNSYLTLVGYAIARYKKNEPFKLLELGCGDGKSSYLLSRNSKLTVTGTDFTQKYIAYARKRFKRPNLNYRVEDATALSFPSNTFDVVCSFELIEHIVQPQKALSEMTRVLSKGGLLVIDSPNLCSPLWGLMDFVKMLAGGSGRLVWAPTKRQAFAWFLTNLSRYVKKKLSSKSNFLFREPDVSGSTIGGDADSVYLACQIDIRKFLIRKGLRILHVAGNPTNPRGRLVSFLLSDLATGMKIIAQKV